MIKKPFRPLQIIGEKDAILQGQKIGYQLKQSPRIRGIRLEIRRGSGLTVIVPKKYTQQSVDDLLESKSRWILRHLSADEPRQMPLFNKEADHGDKLPFMGKNIEIALAPDKAKIPVVELKGNKLIVYSDGAKPDMAVLLENWYREQAAIIFKNKADDFSAMTGLTYRKLLIRGQRTRWGSFSPLGNLTLNWKLLLAPEAVVDYVIIHELCHRKYMNHSRKFWDLVAGYCPNWRIHRKWLLAHEDELKATASFKAYKFIYK
ncbi:MAG: SprT family zinc-dependent metalloprotease [Dehalococcoidia bacterium]|nr:SprT family zinc-dependent metalloprotease [Dehalococcoidia bacterium]MDD5493889.1 SprT family zinc-dependent metalloprotease [Dehalococcoidia bacterium]